ncbi:MAG TPA: hypothetical protein VGM52_06720 [Herbaspirillum sp.]|jgi:hypothetical protein
MSNPMKALVAVVCIACSAQSFALETVKIPEKTDATCHDLGIVAFWASTSHLSKLDKKRQAEAEADAYQKNPQRPAIPKALVEAARLQGTTAHGNAGAGNTNLDAAREDAIYAALMTYSMCVDGRLP